MLFNCAAVNRRMPIADMDTETFDHIVGMDLRMPYFLSQGPRAMADRGGGSIIHVGSTNTYYGLQSTAAYAASKSRTQQAGADNGDRVGARRGAGQLYRPGLMMTPVSEPLWADAAKRRWILDRVPMERPGELRPVFAPRLRCRFVRDRPDVRG